MAPSCVQKDSFPDEKIITNLILRTIGIYIRSGNVPTIHLSSKSAIF